MRALLTTWVGVLMVWMQAVAGLAPHDAQESSRCGCCQCNESACCIPAANPAPVTAPMATAATDRVASENDPLQRRATMGQAQSSPARFAVPHSSTSQAEPIPSLPLYQWHCLLLI